MSIDNQLKARQGQIAAQKREELVPPKIRKTLFSLTEFAVRVSKAQAGLQPLDLLSAFGKMFNEFRDQWGQSNVEYMIEGIVIEIEWLAKRCEQLDGECRRFVDEDWPRLVLKAIEDSRYTRDQSRLDRVIAILGHAGEVADPFSSDRTEHLVRISLELGDAELTMLRMIYDTQNATFERVALANTRSLLRPGEINECWEGLEQSLNSEQKMDLPSLCRTLENYGLVASIGGGVSSLAAYGPWSLLLRGKELVEHLRHDRQQSEEARGR